MRRLVVGLGNPLAGDDGFGPRVLRRLRREGLPQDVELIECSTDLLGLVDVLARYTQVVLVDALVGGDEAPGQVTVLEERTLLPWRARSTDAHRLSPLEALRVFRALEPEASTKVVLVALHTDAIAERPAYATAAALREGARLARAALAETKPEEKGRPGGRPSS